MHQRRAGCFVVLLLIQGGFPTGKAAAQAPAIPQALESWKEWVLWADRQKDCPAPYHDASQHICFWPSRLTISAQAAGATWQLAADVYQETWLPLPGDAEMWPLRVRVNDKPVPVVAVEGRPAVKLPVGKHQLAGEFVWQAMPQRLAVPQQIGILSLTIDDQPVALPTWDGQGDLWLKRVMAEEADKDLLAVRVYRVLEDGIPAWLSTEIELSVAGKSREEILGSVLPEGWKLAAVDSPLPVALEDSGQLKAQVRAGTWVVKLQAFRTTDVGTVRFAPGARPLVSTELVGFRARPELRLAEIEGLVPVDVSQTTFPEPWRNLPVYQWQTDREFRLTEKMRGMGLQRPEGLSIDRQLWLDEDGRGITYRDQLRGQMQQIWRLDVAKGQDVGTIQVSGEPQLITAHPQTGAHGVEIRTRNLELQALGRMNRNTQLQVTGWQTDAKSVRMTFILPPGWRMFAVLGADRVLGDWLTAWSLLDLFLLLIFSLAVFRLWGLWPGIVAFLAFGLAYHEPWSPRFTWFFLLIPLALLRVVRSGTARSSITTWKWAALLLLSLWLIPFVAGQIQSAIYPQLEPAGVAYRTRGYFGWGSLLRQRATRPARQLAEFAEQTDFGPPAGEPSSEFYGAAEGEGRAAKVRALRDSSNLLYDPKAKIQTGPAEPQWDWNRVVCDWRGPVAADQKIRPLLIPQSVHRLLTVLRVLLLLALLACLLRGPRPRRGVAPAALAGITILMSLWTPSVSRAEFPDAQLLETLRARLLQPPDAFPHAADIPFVQLTVRDGRLSMGLEVHAAAAAAVPLPGRLPDWSPVSVSLDNTTEAIVCRREGYLWLYVTPGVHLVQVEGLVPASAEWEWTFLLKPRRVNIAAEGWNVTGIGPNGVPEQQIFFRRQRSETSAEAAYDRRDFEPVLRLDRQLEVGLRWQTRNVVERLTSSGKAVSLRIPLLQGERVLSPGVQVTDGFVELRLPAGSSQLTWNSELPPGAPIDLEAARDVAWVERWQLEASPVWHTSLTGLEPVFEAQPGRLVPVWHPWPGERVSLSFSKPTAVAGDTITVQQVRHQVALGERHRTTQLQLDLTCSLAEDFRVAIDAENEITSLTRGGQNLPVRREDGQLVVPLQPGKQTVAMAWERAKPLGLAAAAGRVVLPVDASNVTTEMNMPRARWILWAAGPLRGPAVRFWTILACALLTALVLGSLPASPLRRREWVLLALGLTQLHVVAALTVVGWFFWLAWRGRLQPEQMPAWRFNLLQMATVVLTCIVLGILVAVVGEGLLGDPQMFIQGHQSWGNHLSWFQPRSGVELPDPRVLSVSVWYFRVLMLLWALWLASALLRWLTWAWQQFTHEASWRRVWKRRPVVSES